MINNDSISVFDIEKYSFKDDYLKNNKPNEEQTNVYFNEDNEIEENNIDKSFITQDQASNINDI